MRLISTNLMLMLVICMIEAAGNTVYVPWVCKWRYGFQKKNNHLRRFWDVSPFVFPSTSIFYKKRERKLKNLINYPISLLLLLLRIGSSKQTCSKRNWSPWYISCFALAKSLDGAIARARVACSSSNTSF